MKYLPFLLALVFLPSALYAAEFSVVPVTAPAAGQPFTVEVRLDPEGEFVNVVEGTLLIPGGLSVESVSTGGSGLVLWPGDPGFTHEDRSIAFSGGVPGAGLTPNGAQVLFTLRVLADEGGTYTFRTQGLGANRADGTGARVVVDVGAVSVRVSDLSGEPPVREETDRSNPKNVQAELGQDDSLFDGAWFVSFYGSDEGSGIKRYEVKEGWFGTYLPADRYYIVSDQSLGTPIFVRAIDEAGNTKSVYVKGSGELQYYGAFALPLILLALVAWFFLRRRL